MKRLRRALEKHGYIFAIVCIIVSTLVFLPGREHFAKGQWALLYLLIISLVAGVVGVAPALLAAVLAFLSWNFFFIPPFHTLSVHDTQDWLSLISFLLVGVAMGVQTGRMRQREAEALSREQEMALLNRFSAHLVSDAETADVVNALFSEVNSVLGAATLGLFLPDKTEHLHPLHPTGQAAPEQDPSLAAIAESVYRQSQAVGLPQSKDDAETAEHRSEGACDLRGDVFLPLQSTSRKEGVLYVGARADGTPYHQPEARLLVAVANQLAAFMERKRLHALAVQADALREADRLKSTLVSSVSHELKTPLASVIATVSSLLEGDVEWEEENVRGELVSIQEDLGRLNASIGSLLDLSRLESAAWTPKRDWYEFGEILATTLTRLPQKQRSRISFDIPEDLPPLHVDFDQWVRVLQNLLENALLYSPEGSPVCVTASAAGEDLAVTVEDAGPGIPAEERERVFEKFYRGSSSEHVPSGTGLGLAITREIVRAHGGRISVEDVVPHGARFVIFLPIETDAEGDA